MPKRRKTAITIKLPSLEQTLLPFAPQIRTLMPDATTRRLNFIWSLSPDGRIMYVPIKNMAIALFDTLVSGKMEYPITQVKEMENKCPRLYQFVDTGNRRGWALFWLVNNQHYLLARVQLTDREMITQRAVCVIHCGYSQARIDRFCCGDDRWFVRVGSNHLPNWELHTNRIIPLNDDGTLDDTEEFAGVEDSLEETKDDDPVEFGGLPRVNEYHEHEPIFMKLCNRRTRTLSSRKLVFDPSSGKYFQRHWQFVGAHKTVHAFTAIGYEEMALFVDIETGQCRFWRIYEKIQNTSYINFSVISFLCENFFVIVDDYCIRIFRIRQTQPLTVLAFKSMKAMHAAVYDEKIGYGIVIKHPAIPRFFQLHINQNPARKYEKYVVPYKRKE